MSDINTIQKTIEERAKARLRIETNNAIKPFKDFCSNRMPGWPTLTVEGAEIQINTGTIDLIHKAMFEAAEAKFIADEISMFVSTVDSLQQQIDDLRSQTPNS